MFIIIERMFIAMAENTVNKKNIVDQVSERVGLTKKDAGEATETVLNVIKESLEKGDRVNIINFGSFEVRERAPRTGRNPQTGEEIKIPAHQTPAFKPGKLLRDAVRK